MAFAKTVKENSDFKSFPRSIKDGTSRRRVLPGIHTCAEDGTWCKKYNTHTYGVPHDGDSEKKDYHTFHCVEVVEWQNREKVVLETCPENVLIEDQDAEYKRLQVKLTEELKAGKRTKEDVHKLLRPFIDWKKRHGKSFWWAVNVMDGDGKCFTEKWPNDVKKLFDAIKKKLRDESNIGAILPIEQGVWLDIVKTPGKETGTGFPKYAVEVVREKLEGGLERIKQAPIAADVADEAEKSCWDLNDCGVITLSREQVKALAASGDEPMVLRGIFKQSVKAPATPKVQEKVETKTPLRTEAVVDTDTGKKPEANVETPRPASKGPAVESEDDRTIREAEEAIARAQARRAAARAELLKASLPKTEEKAENKIPLKAEVTKTEEKQPEKGFTKVEAATPQAGPAKGADEDIDAFMAKYNLPQE